MQLPTAWLLPCLGLPTHLHGFQCLLELLPLGPVGRMAHQFLEGREGGRGSPLRAAALEGPRRAGVCPEPSPQLTPCPLGSGQWPSLRASPQLSEAVVRRRDGTVRLPAHLSHHGCQAAHPSGARSSFVFLRVILIYLGG